MFIKKPWIKREVPHRDALPSYLVCPLGKPGCWIWSCRACLKYKAKGAISQILIEAIPEFASTKDSEESDSPSFDDAQSPEAAGEGKGCPPHAREGAKSPGRCSTEQADGIQATRSDQPNQRSASESASSDSARKHRSSKRKRSPADDMSRSCSAVPARVTKRARSQHRDADSAPVDSVKDLTCDLQQVKIKNLEQQLASAQKEIFQLRSAGSKPDNSSGSKAKKEKKRKRTS